MKINAADLANLALLAIPPALQRKLARAVPVPTEKVPPDAVTMLSRVVVVDTATARQREVTVVYPGEADAAAGRVSVLEPLGTALFGASIGDAIECETAEGRCALRIEEMLYQPERWMRTHLIIRE